jgi:hypothetical protein
MLNTPCKHPLPLEPGQTIDPSKAARYHLSRAKACKEAAAGSFGWRRKSYQSEANHHWSTAVWYLLR